MGKREITSEKILLVEGKDEELFFEALTKSLEIKNIQIIEIKGKDNFKTIIPNLINLKNFKDVKIIGVVRDADNDAQASFESICNSLKNAKLDCPKTDAFTNGAVKVGIFIMPGKKQKGMLEDLCLKTISKNEKECIDTFFDCFPDKPKNISKSKLQAYLSSRKDFVHSLGLAAQKGYFDFNDETFTELKSFIENFR